jgi:hypothetical protein
MEGLENFNFIVDRQFGVPLRLLVDDNGIITDCEDWEYKGKMKAKLVGMSVEEAIDYYKTSWKGIVMIVRPAHYGIPILSDPLLRLWYRIR